MRPGKVAYWHAAATKIASLNAVDANADLYAVSTVEHMANKVRDLSVVGQEGPALFEAVCASLCAVRRLL